MTVYCCSAALTSVSASVVRGCDELVFVVLVAVLVLLFVAVEFTLIVEVLVLVIFVLDVVAEFESLCERSDSTVSHECRTEDYTFEVGCDSPCEVPVKSCV